MQTDRTLFTIAKVEKIHSTRILQLPMQTLYNVDKTLSSNITLHFAIFHHLKGMEVFRLLRQIL